MFQIYKLCCKVNIENISSNIKGEIIFWTDVIETSINYYQNINKHIEQAKSNERTQKWYFSILIISALKLVVKKMFAVNNLETDDLMPEYTYGLVYNLLYLVNILVLGIHLQKKSWVVKY